MALSSRRVPLGAITFLEWLVHLDDHNIVRVAPRAMAAPTRISESVIDRKPTRKNNVAHHETCTGQQWHGVARQGSAGRGNHRITTTDGDHESLDNLLPCLSLQIALIQPTRNPVLREAVLSRPSAFWTPAAVGPRCNRALKIAMIPEGCPFKRLTML